MNPLIKASGAEENNPNRVILSARSLSLFVFLSGCLPTIGQDDNFAVMDETVIIASRAEELSSQTAGSSAAITSEDILALGATNLTDALKYEPGVSIPFDTAGSDGLVPYLAGGDSAINIRGLEGNRISINIDGIRQPEDFTVRSFGGTGGPGRIYFDPATFSQIELYKSAASSLYGSDALGGAVSGRVESALTLLGEELDGFTLHNSSQYSSVNDSFHNRLAYAWGNGKTAYSFLYSFRTGSERENNSSVQEANPADFESHAFVGTINWRPYEDFLITATADYYRNDVFAELNSAEGNAGGGITNTEVNSDDHRERARFSLDFNHSPSANNTFYDQLALKFYWQDATAETDNLQQRFDGDFVNRINDISYNTEIAGFALQGNKELGKHFLTAGLETSISEVDASFERTNTSLLANPGGVEFLDLISMAPSDVYRAGIFISDRFTFGDRDQFVLTPTIRADYYEVSPDNTAAFLSQSGGAEAPDYDNFAISPSISVSYHFTETFNAYGVWSQGTRNPSAEDLSATFDHVAVPSTTPGVDELMAITAPNPDLEEERSNSFEIGLQYADDKLNARIAGFYNNYTDFLEAGVLNTGLTTVTTDPNTGLTTENQFFQTVNNAEVEIYGVEVKADWKIGEQYPALTGLSSGGSISWIEGRANDSDGRGDQPLNTIDPWSAVAYLAYNHPDESFGARLTTTYVSNKSRSDIDSPDGSLTPSDSYLAIDLTSHYQITENIRLRGGVTNFLDEEYVTWASARRGQGHGFTNIDRSFFTSPGRSFFVSVDLAF